MGSSRWAIVSVSCPKSTSWDRASAGRLAPSPERWVCGPTGVPHQGAELLGPVERLFGHAARGRNVRARTVDAWEMVFPMHLRRDHSRAVIAAAGPSCRIPSGMPFTATIAPLASAESADSPHGPVPPDTASIVIDGPNGITSRLRTRWRELADAVAAIPDRCFARGAGGGRKPSRRWFRPWADGRRGCRDWRDCNAGEALRLRRGLGYAATVSRRSLDESGSDARLRMR
jgi:hypothetical protein